MIYKTIFAIIAVLLLAGCAKVETPNVVNTQASPESINSVVAANNQFAFELYSKYKDENKNVFFSPYSISTALAMTYEGARGKTAEEMQNVFHFPEESVRLPAYASIYNELNKGSSDYKLNTANALWAQKDFTFLKEYFDLVGNYYGGKVTNLDFVSETEKSRQTINNWVAGQTNDKIKDIIPVGVLNSMTRLVLTNAIYFKGTWQIQFKKSNTQEADFRISPLNTIKVPMMHLSGEKANFNYLEIEHLQILELPYEGNDLSMLILLPEECIGDFVPCTNYMKMFEDSLTAEKLSELKSQMRESNVAVSLPKFKFETKYFMANTLAEMGMPTAFSDTDADFSGMDGKKDLYISDVIHQAFVDVNEEGTEAAAATAVVMAMKSAGPGIIFNADHPFIFVIQQKQTGNILFMGKVIDPR